MQLTTYRARDRHHDVPGGKWDRLFARLEKGEFEPIHRAEFNSFVEEQLQMTAIAVYIPKISGNEVLVVIESAKRPPVLCFQVTSADPDIMPIGKAKQIANARADMWTEMVENEVGIDFSGRG